MTSGSSMRDDPHRPAAERIGLDVDLEHPFQALLSGHRCALFEPVSAPPDPRSRYADRPCGLPPV